jgi:hypothetical protein
MKQKMRYATKQYYLTPPLTKGVGHSPKGRDRYNYHACAGKNQTTWSHKLSFTPCRSCCLRVHHIIIALLIPSLCVWEGVGQGLFVVVVVVVCLFALESAGALYLGPSSQAFPKAELLDAVWLRGAMAVCSMYVGSKPSCIHVWSVSGVPQCIMLYVCGWHTQLYYVCSVLWVDLAGLRAEPCGGSGPALPKKSQLLMKPDENADMRRMLYFCVFLR